MDTAYQELLFTVASVAITAVFSILTYYIKTKIDVERYGLDRSKVDDILDDAIYYVEGRTKNIAKKKISSIEKRNMAIDYINKLDPEIIRKYDKKIELLIDRKVARRFGVKPTRYNKG